MHRSRRSNRQRIGADSLPILEDEAMRFKPGANARGIPTESVLENRNEHAEGVVDYLKSIIASPRDYICDGSVPVSVLAGVAERTE